MATAAITPLRTPSTLRGAVAEHLRIAIVSGELAPGSLLKEVELAARLGVSPTPIREAMGELAAEGLVEIEPNRLKRVVPIDAQAMLNLFRVQGALWRLGYIWSFQSIGATELAELEAALAAYQRALDAGDLLAAIRAGHDFHTVFVEASGNGELLRVTLDRRALIARFILLCGASSVSGSGLEQHRRILDAVRSGDLEGALARLDQLSAKLIELAQSQINLSATRN